MGDERMTSSESFSLLSIHGSFNGAAVDIVLETLKHLSPGVTTVGIDCTKVTGIMPLDALRLLEGRNRWNGSQPTLYFIGLSPDLEQFFRSLELDHRAIFVRSIEEIHFSG